MKSAIAIAALVLIGVVSSSSSSNLAWAQTPAPAAAPATSSTDPELSPDEGTYAHAICVGVESTGDGAAVRYCVGDDCKPGLRLPKVGCLMVRRLGRTDLTIQAVDEDGGFVGDAVTVTYRIDKSKVVAESFDSADAAHWWHTHGEPLIGAVVGVGVKAKVAPAPAAAPVPMATAAELEAAKAAAKAHTDGAVANLASTQYVDGQVQTGVAEGFRVYRGEVDGRYVSQSTEADNRPSLGIGPLAMSVSDTGMILAGTVGAEINFPGTQWNPVLRIVGGVFYDGQKRRGVFGGDIAILHPLTGGGKLDLGPLMGWYGVNTSSRVMDLPTVALAARYRLASWLYAMGQVGGTVPLDERSDGTEDQVPDVEFTLGVGVVAHL